MDALGTSTTVSTVPSGSHKSSKYTIRPGMSLKQQAKTLRRMEVKTARDERRDTYPSTAPSKLTAAQSNAWKHGLGLYRQLSSTPSWQWADNASSWRAGTKGFSRLLDRCNPRRATQSAQSASVKSSTRQSAGAMSYGSEPTDGQSAQESLESTGQALLDKLKKIYDKDALAQDKTSLFTDASVASSIRSFNTAASSAVSAGSSKASGTTVPVPNGS